MGIFLTFLLGIGNFAAQSAVFGSRHPMLASLSPLAWRSARRASLVVEFVLLLAALFAATGGHSAWVWMYAGYSLLNLFAAWLIAVRRV